jgi:palmitoyltransferase
VWPPPDPDRGYKRHMKAVNGDAFVYQNEELSKEDTVAAFRQRQDQDVVRKRRPFVERLEERVKDEDEDDEDYVYGDDASDAGRDEKETYGNGEGEEGWRNAEGECLKDFGVDEDVEFYDEQEDEIPLAELMARRRTASNATVTPSYS